MARPVVTVPSVRHKSPEKRLQCLPRDDMRVTRAAYVVVMRRGGEEAKRKREPRHANHKARW